MFNTDSLPDAIIGAVDMAKNYEQLAELDDMLKEYAPNTTAFFETRDDYPTGLYSPGWKKFIHYQQVMKQSIILLTLSFGLTRNGLII